jgi:DNA ligase (NAD+)
MTTLPVEEAAALRAQILSWAEAYFERDAPVVADADYDQAMKQLEALEREFPDLVTPDSPTQRVGAAPLSEFESVEHRLPMLSLDNAFSSDDMDDFHRRVTERLGDGDVSYPARRVRANECAGQSRQ